MKNLSAIIALSFFCCSIPTLKAQMITYSGPVEFRLEVSKNAGGGGSDDGYDWNVSVNEKRLIDATFYVTFTGGTGGIQGLSAFKLTSVEESIDFVNTVSNTGEDQKSSQPCYNDRLEFTHKATPGDTRKRSTTVVSSRLNTGKPFIEGGQLMFRGDEYFLTMMGTLRMNITSENYNEEYFPCLDKQTPPKSVSQTTTIDFPIGIGTKMKLGNLDYLEGTNVVDNTVSDNCNQCIPGELARLVHGDMQCSYISKISTSWMLVKRSEECDATIRFVKGDVKFNGVPATNGARKVGEGDVITTGPKSRIEVRLSDGSCYRLGSKTKLVLSAPCAKSGKPSLIDVLQGKLYVKVNEIMGGDQSFNPNTRTAVTGRRGFLIPSQPLFYASADPDFVPCPLPESKPPSTSSSVQQHNPEKDELIEGYESLPENTTAYYLDLQDGIVLEVTALKGTIRIEDDMGIRSMEVPEGTTVTCWEDGTQMTEITILTK
ncbi:MAG: FecR family protein [Bacteroidales bacterium]|jgi:hypothetical protein|nr:FecR family protein [Bacteroidales bacterium]